MSPLSGFTVALLASVGMSISFHANSTATQASAASPSTAAQPASADSQHARSLPKSRSRNCLRETGSLIPPKNGECLPVNGRSYSGDDLRSTGVNDNARALQMLDPSIRAGGH